MLAHHPVTGKEIRVIQTDASIWKEHKTLRFGLAKGSPWDTVSAEWESGSAPDFFIQLEDVSDSHLKMISSRVKVLLISRAVLGSRTVAEFKALQIGNVLGLEELHSIYPHLGGAWDGTVEDAVVMLAGLLRYRRLAGVWNNRAAALNLKQVPDAPPRLWWLTQYYTPPTSKRRREIQKCLEVNAKSKFIDRIILLNEKEETLPVSSEKIDQRIIGKRLTYADVLRAGAEMPLDVILVFANADICIDDGTWKQLWDVNLEDKFLALLRYDVPDSGRLEEAQLFGPRPDSQDTWVIRVEDIVKREATICKGLDFQFGRMGCDNAVALEMLRQKFLVVNPCLSLKTYHFHTSGVRNYEKTDVIERPMFHYIHPSGFHDLQPVLKVDGAKKLASLVRPIRGSGANQWMVGVNRKLGTEDTPFKLNNTNTVTPSAETTITLKNCFMTAEGLVYDRDKLWIGPGQRAQKVWATAAVNAMTPSLECKKGLCVEWAKGADESRELYVLKVLSKVFRLTGIRDIVSQGYEFVCPEKKEVIEALETFDWRTARLPVIKYDPEAVVWCKEALVAPVSENTFVLSEDIEALRGALPSWSSTVKTFGGRMRIVLVEDGVVLTAGFIQQLEDVLERAWDIKVVYPGKTSAHRMFDCFNGAWGVIYGGAGGFESCGWNWMLPKGGYVIEVGGEFSQGLEVSAASGLEHRFVLKHLERIFETVWEENEAWVASNSTGEDDSRPLIWMPRKDLEGYFAHPGDSFREMVRLWARSGLCRVREHSLATMVWWGDVGAEGYLLYDRPNHDWRLAAPLVEKSWKKALFGNPKVPSGAANCSPWFFWPRRPEFVEELAQGTLRGWEDRKDGIVFYGKTENKVQEKRRSAADWKSACSEWVMVKGDEAYPFTQKEYLENLAKARFGLCLAGYGYKCHREVECMAVGCVPVCAPEVDMDSYANPPVEGVHYIRVSSPEEALAKVESMSEVDWERMSKAGRVWWKENCSVAGSFALTKRLLEQKDE